MFDHIRGRDGARRASVRVQVTVKPWHRQALHAEWAMLPAGPIAGRGRRSAAQREIPSVVITAGHVQAQMHAHDVLRLVEHKTSRAEPLGEPDSMLCWPEAAAETYTVAGLIEDLPRDSLVLVADPVTAGVKAVVTGIELETLTLWVLDLPHWFC